MVPNAQPKVADRPATASDGDRLGLKRANLEDGSAAAEPRRLNLAKSAPAKRFGRPARARTSADEADAAQRWLACKKGGRPLGAKEASSRLTPASIAPRWFM